MTPNFYPRWGNVQAPPIEMAEGLMHDLCVRATQDSDFAYLQSQRFFYAEERLSDAKFFALEKLLRPTEEESEVKP